MADSAADISKQRTADALVTTYGRRTKDKFVKIFLKNLVYYKKLFEFDVENFLKLI